MDGFGGQRDSPEVKALIEEFYAKQMHDIVTGQCAVGADQLPVTRIKRVMKSDTCGHPTRMISAHVPSVMAVTAQLFIGCLTFISWKLFTQKAKRNTLLLKDLMAAVSSSSKFDFLVDIVDMFGAMKKQEVEGRAGMGTESKDGFALRQLYPARPLQLPDHNPTRQQPMAGAGSSSDSKAVRASIGNKALATHSAPPPLLTFSQAQPQEEDVPAMLGAWLGASSNPALMEEEDLLAQLGSLPGDLLDDLGAEYVNDLVESTSD